MQFDDLSSEQKNFIRHVKNGENVLVDACIGSGKTTAIQVLCNELSHLSILYLTYNRLLKIDAQEKIKSPNVFVTNYHGYAWRTLNEMGIRAGQSDLIQTFNRIKPEFAKFHLLVIDEYQDIEQELAEMLKIIKEQNYNLQIVAVGDMEQKIYDKTTLEVPSFMKELLGDYTLLHFTKCFRLSHDIAQKLGNVWQKKIDGVNTNCKVEIMKISDVISFLANQEPKDVLCLGARNGNMPNTLNALETCYPAKYNKNTIYANIQTVDRGNVNPTKDTGIFTTFDSSKGLERKICVIFDYDISYWSTRLGFPMTKYEIIRNIFCVAASRGKEHIIFVEADKTLLTEKDLSTPLETNNVFEKPIDMSGAFSFRYKEDVEKCFSFLKTVKVEQKSGKIHIKNRDGMIDLSPCIGKFQEVIFFDNYDLNQDIELIQKLHDNRPYKPNVRDIENIQEKILNVVAMETGYDRYVNQVDLPFIKEEESKCIMERLGTVFEPDEEVQRGCWLSFITENREMVTLKGRLDVLKDNIVYELKFTEELSHENFLQCALYMTASNIKTGRLWNTQNNEMYEITIPDRGKFLQAVLNAVTKGAIKKYRFVEFGTTDNIYILTDKKVKLHGERLTEAEMTNALLETVRRIKSDYDELDEIDDETDETNEADETVVHKADTSDKANNKAEKEWVIPIHKPKEKLSDKITVSKGGTKIETEEAASIKNVSGVVVV